MYSTFHEDTIGLDFCCLLIVIMSKDLIMRILVRFSDNNSDCFYTFKVLVDSLVLFLGKNVSIHEAKSAYPIFTPG